MRILSSAFKAAIAAQFLIVMPAFAEEMFVTPSVGSEGVAVSGGYKSDNNWGVTTKFSTFAWNWNGTVGGNPTTANLRFLNIGGTFDYYPNGGNFRVSAGARVSANKVTGTQTQGPATAKYTLKQNRIQPYVGAGYSHDLVGNMALDLEVGAYYAGPTKLTSTGNVSVAGATATATTSGTSSTHSFYPVGQLGLKMKF